MTPEAWAFVLSVICGFVAMSILDVRNAISAGPGISIILDVLWWCVAAGMFAFCMWQTVDFNVRFFQIIGAGTGAVLEHFTIGRFVAKFAVFLFGVIFKILLTPWAFLYKIIVVPINRRVISKSRKVAKNDSPQKQDN